MKKFNLKKIKFDYSYVIIALCFLTVCLSLGFCSSPKSMYLKAITNALGMERGAFSLNDTLRYVTTSVTTVFIGFLVSKFGVKKLLCAGFIGLIGFALISSVASTLVGFYISGVLLGFGLSFTSTSMASIVINKWCSKNKGTIMGIVLAANGFGGALAAQVLSPIIFEEGNPFGYRNSYYLVALIIAVLLVLVALFFKDAPKGADKTLTVGKKKARGTGWVGMDYADAVKKPYFYVALVCVFFTGMSLQGIGGIVSPLMYDIGFEESFVANLLSLGSLCLLFSKFFVGFMFDRFGIKLTMNTCFFSALVTLAGAMMIGNSPFGRAAAVTVKIFDALALPLETIMLPIFVSELFGNKSFDKAVGIFVAVNYAGYALSSPFANFCFDIFGNYNIPMSFFLVVMAAVAVMMNFVVRAANADKRAILANAEE